MIFVKPYIAPPSKSGDSIDILLDPKAYPKTSVYIKLTLKKYYRFPEMRVANSFEGELYITNVSSETFCYTQTFPVWVAAKSKLNAEVLEAVKQYSANEYWENQDLEVIDKYLKYIKVYYAAMLTRDEVKYDVDLKWEIDYNN